MEKGKIQQKGTYKELLNEGYDFANLLKELQKENETSLSLSGSKLKLSKSGQLSNTESNHLIEVSDSHCFTNNSYEGLLKVSTSNESLEIPLENEKKLIEKGTLTDVINSFYFILLFYLFLKK